MEKLVYDGYRFRTTLVNDTAQYIFLKNKELRAKKMEQKSSKKSLPHNGWLMGLEPTTLGTTNQYSNQLSYNHRVFSVTKVRLLIFPANIFF